MYTLTGATANSNKSYRVVVSNACTNTSATTAIKTIKVDPTAVAGTITGGSIVCRLSGGTLTAANYVGKVQWEYSTNGATFSNAPKSADNQTALPFRTTSTTSTGTTYAITSITANLYFRIKVSSGSCTPVYSNMEQFTLGSQAVAGTISPASVELCPRAGTTLTLSNAVGTITWQKSTNYTMTTPTWTAIANSNATTLATGALTVSTAYRAMVTIGSCSTVYSTVAIVAITAKPVAKPITANVTTPSGKTALTAMCTTDVSKILSIGSGYVGTVQWQSSVTSATTGFTDIPGANSQSYTVTNPVAGANYFRATFSNTCGASVAGTAVTVYYTNCAPAKTELPQTKLPFDVVAYPNPYNEDFRLNLTTSSESEVTILLYDMTGKLLDKTTARPTDVATIPIGKHYPSGVYNLILTQGDQLKTIRVIKR